MAKKKKPETIKFHVGFLGKSEGDMNAVMAAIDPVECLARTADVALTFGLPGNYKIAVQEQAGTQQEFDEAEETFVRILNKYKAKFDVEDNEELDEEVRRIAKEAINEAEQKRVNLQ